MPEQMPGRGPHGARTGGQNGARNEWGQKRREPLSLTAFGTRIVGGLTAQALSERLLQRDGSAMLLEKITERLIGQLLERPHAVARQQAQRVPGLGVELDELADLGRAPAGVRSMLRALCHASTHH